MSTVNHGPGPARTSPASPSLPGALAKSSLGLRHVGMFEHGSANASLTMISGTSELKSVSEPATSPRILPGGSPWISTLAETGLREAGTAPQTTRRKPFDFIRGPIGMTAAGAFVDSASAAHR